MAIDKSSVQMAYDAQLLTCMLEVFGSYPGWGIEHTDSIFHDFSRTLPDKMMMTQF